MSKLKVHYEIIETPPSESDPGGYLNLECLPMFFSTYTLKPLSVTSQYAVSGWEIAHVKEA